MHAPLNKHRCFRLPALAAALAIASVSAHAADAPARASIQPSLVRLATGARCQFKVVLAPQWLQPATVAEGVEWSINDKPGGDVTVGTIDSHGIYHAPAKVSLAREFHVCGKVKDAANVYVWATAIVGKGDIAYKQTAAWDETVTEKPTGLAMPVGIATDRDGTLLIADGGTLYRYTMDGTFVERFGIKKEGDSSPVVGPRDVAVGLDGRICVCDAQTGPPRVKVFNRAGERVGGFGPKGIGPGQIMQSQGMTIDPEGKRLLVADSENMRLNLYSTDGALLGMWDKAGVMPGQFAEPYGVVIDRSGDVYVPNHYGPCQKFSAKGEYLFAFAEPDPPKGVVNITAITGDRWGNVYLVVRDSAGIPLNSVNPEPKSVRIMKYNSSGDLVATIPLWDDERSENKMLVDEQDRLHVMFRRGSKVGMATLEPR